MASSSYIDSTLSPKQSSRRHKRNLSKGLKAGKENVCKPRDHAILDLKE